MLKIKGKMAPADSLLLHKRGPMALTLGGTDLLEAGKRLFHQDPSLVGSRGVAEATHSFLTLLSGDPDFVLSLEISWLVVVAGSISRMTLLPATWDLVSPWRETLPGCLPLIPVQR